MLQALKALLGIIISFRAGTFDVLEQATAQPLNADCDNLRLHQPNCQDEGLVTALKVVRSLLDIAVDNLPQRLAEWRHFSDLPIAAAIDLGNRATGEDFDKLVAGIGSELFDDNACFDRMSAIVQTTVAQGAEGTTKQTSMDKMGMRSKSS